MKANPTRRYAWYAAFTGLALSACGPPPPPPAPATRVPKNPFDSAGVVRDEGAAEISFDSTGEPLSVSATVGFKSLLLCAATPCVTRLPPGGYAIHLGRQNYIGSTVLFQATRKPTIVTASCDEYTEYGNKHLTCTIAASHPADGKVYEGSLQ